MHRLSLHRHRQNRQESQPGDELLAQQLFDVLDLDYEEWKDKLPQPEDDDPYADMNGAIDANIDGGGVIE